MDIRRVLFAGVLLGIGGICIAEPNPESIKCVEDCEKTEGDLGPVSKLIGIMQPGDEDGRPGTTTTASSIQQSVVPSEAVASATPLADNMKKLQEKEKLMAFDSVVAPSAPKPSILTPLWSNGLANIPKLGSNVKVPSIPSLRERMPKINKSPVKTGIEAPIIDPAYNYDDLTESNRKPFLTRLENRLSTMMKQIADDYRGPSENTDTSSSNVAPSILTIPTKWTNPTIRERLGSKLASLRKSSFFRNPESFTQDTEASPSGFVSSISNLAPRIELPSISCQPIRIPLNIKSDKSVMEKLRLLRLNLTPDNEMAASNTAPSIVSSPLMNRNLAPKLEELRNRLITGGRTFLRASNSEASPINNKPSILKSSSKIIEELNSQLDELKIAPPLPTIIKEDLEQKLAALKNKFRSMESTGLLRVSQDSTTSSSNNKLTIIKSPSGIVEKLNTKLVSLENSSSLEPLKKDFESKLEPFRNQFRSNESTETLLMGSLQDNAAFPSNENPTNSKIPLKDNVDLASGFDILKKSAPLTPLKKIESPFFLRNPSLTNKTRSEINAAKVAQDTVSSASDGVSSIGPHPPRLEFPRLSIQPIKIPIGDRSSTLELPATPSQLGAPQLNPSSDSEKAACTVFPDIINNNPIVNETETPSSNNLRIPSQIKTNLQSRLEEFENDGRNGEDKEESLPAAPRDNESSSSEVNPSIAIPRIDDTRRPLMDLFRTAENKQKELEEKTENVKGDVMRTLTAVSNSTEVLKKGVSSSVRDALDIIKKAAHKAGHSNDNVLDSEYKFEVIDQQETCKICDCLMRYIPKNVKDGRFVMVQNEIKSDKTTGETTKANTLYDINSTEDEKFLETKLETRLKRMTDFMDFVENVENYLNRKTENLISTVSIAI